MLSDSEHLVAIIVLVLGYDTEQRSDQYVAWSVWLLAMGIALIA